MSKINIRPVLFSDSSDIFSWRNDPLTIQMSKSMKGVTLEEHERWFKAVLDDEDIIFLICEMNNDLLQVLKIGTVRFDMHANISAKITINLNPTHRGQYLAKPCLQDSIDYFIKNNTTISQFIAEIKNDNVNSQKIFCDLGFELKQSIDNNFSQYMFNLKK